MTLAQLAFPHVPGPRSSLLHQRREAQDWQLPVECPDWRRWSDGDRERLCWKPRKSSKEMCPPSNNLFSVQLVRP